MLPVTGKMVMLVIGAVLFQYPTVMRAIWTKTEEVLFWACVSALTPLMNVVPA